MKNSKPIKGFENYLIFPDGKIFSLKRQIYLKPDITTSGYYQVTLCKSGKPYSKLISRLVAQAFIPNPDNKPEVNHKDGNKLNNKKSNLEWSTHSENMLHAFATGLKKPSSNVGGPKIPISVYNYKTGKFLSTQPSQRAATRKYGVCEGSISKVLVGKLNHTGGLTFIKVLK